MEEVTKKLIIVEGKDDALFIDAFCQFLEIKNLITKRINQEISAGGKSNLFLEKDISQTIKIPDYDQISQIAIACDADYRDINDGFSTTKIKLENVIKNLSENENLGLSDKKFEFFIFPNNCDDGNLESLFLQCLSENLKSKIDCVDFYFECLNKKDFAIEAHKLDKIKSQILLTALGYQDNLYSVGYAASKTKCPENYLDFQSLNLEPLKQFLLKLSNS